ncbi:hypothetical protein [Nocardia wallacei]|uniref:hypothetical protein n=1 Tax=Nocardia wallacei TaxID=480035 RepID=UPI002455B357|nr:hypothetical protein [Nocardia wallacei]
MSEDETRRAAEAELERRRRAADRARKRDERSKGFHRGMAQERGETPERGWKHEHQLQVPGTRGKERRFDTAHPQEKKFREYKSGAVSGREVADQLEKDARFLEAGWSGQWVIPEHAYISPEIEARLLELAEQHRDRFAVVRVSKDERDRAIRLGKELGRNQLELIPARDLEKMERARRLERARRRDARVKQMVQRAKQPHQQQKARQREPREQKARDERTRTKPERKPITKEARDRAANDAAQKVAREFGEKYMNPARGRDEPEPVGTGSRAAPEKGERTRGQERDPAIELARQQQRQAADRLAEQAQRARDAAAKGQPGDMVREVADLLRVTQPTPGIEPPSRDAIEAARTRGGREERGRERGIEPRGR